MFLGVKMFDLNLTICDKTMKVMIFDCNILGMRSHICSNHDYNCPLIVFVICDWFLKKITPPLECHVEFQEQIKFPS